MDFYQKYIKYKKKYLNLTKMNSQKLITLEGGNNKDNIEMYKWIEYFKPLHLTIKDLKKWKTNEIKDVAIFDRNFEEYFIDNLKENHNYNPSYFFKKNRHKIKKNNDLTWEISFHFENICPNIEVNVENLTSNCVWHPLDQEYIIFDKSHKLEKNIKNKIYWEDLDENTRIGWRGPIMLWKDIEKKHNPKIYWIKPT